MFETSVLSYLGCEGTREVYPPVGNPSGSIFLLPVWQRDYLNSQKFYEAGKKEKSQNF